MQILERSIYTRLIPSGIYCYVVNDSRSDGFNAQVGQARARCRKTQSTTLIFAKISLWAGSTLTLLSVAAFSIAAHPTCAAEYYLGTIGMSLIIAGLVSFIN